MKLDKTLHTVPRCNMLNNKTHSMMVVSPISDILVLKLISVLVFILFSSQNFYII